MYLQVKKADSVTSILLFLFNVFLVKRGIRKISIKRILRLLEPFNKSETSVRMGLSRGVRNGLLVNIKYRGEVYYGITNEAEQTFSYWWQTLQQFQDRVRIQTAPWGGMWTLIYLEKNRDDDFPLLLKQHGFGSLEKSLWMSPYDLKEQTIDLINKVSDKKNIYLFRSTLVETKKEDLVNNTWDVKELNSRYKKYLADLNKAINEYDGNSNNQALPILHLYGMGFFHIIQDDPQLPLELLPKDWSGIEAAQRFLSIREKYLPGAKLYIDKVIETPNYSV